MVRISPQIDRKASISLDNTRGIRERRAVFLGIATIAIWQMCFSYQLRFTNYFNDDLEAIAAGVFFRSLYINQFCVHLPLQAILSHWWIGVAGASTTANRMFVGVMNTVIEALILLIGRRVGGLLAGSLAAVFYILMEASNWAYLNLTELPSVLFALCAVYFGLSFSRPQLRVEIARPFWFGVFLSLSFLARLMAIPLIGCILLLPLIGSGYLRKLRRSALPAALGAAIPLVSTWLYFAAIGSWKALVFWSFLYNQTAKAEIQMKGWTGDLTVPTIVNTWIFVGASLAITLICYFMALRDKRAELLRALMICWLPALAGWIGANPSGIDLVAFHAIPAMPFLCLSLGLGVTAIWRESVFPPTELVLPLRFATAVGALAAVLPFLQNTFRIEQDHKTDPHYEHAARIGAYIESHTKPSDSIFVFGADPLIYVAAHRNNGTEFSIVVEYVGRLEDRMLDELKKARPAAVVFDKTDYWHYRNIETFPKVAAYIAQNYRESEEYGDVLMPSAEATIPVVRTPEKPKTAPSTDAPL